VPSPGRPTGDADPLGPPLPSRIRSGIDAEAPELDLDALDIQLERFYPSDDEWDEGALASLPVVIPEEVGLTERVGGEGAGEGESGGAGDGARGKSGEEASVDLDNMGKGRRKRKAPSAMRQYEDPNNVEQLKTTTPYWKQVQIQQARGPGRPSKYG